MMLLLFVLLGVTSWAKPSVQQLLDKLSLMRESLQQLEEEVKLLADSPSAATEPELKDTASLEASYSAAGFDPKSQETVSDILSLSSPSKEGVDFNRQYLEKILESLLYDPLNKKDRRTLKYFIREAQDDKLRAEALFFLGEVYLLRKTKQTDPERAKKDVHKAIGSFSKSYNLDPHSVRTPKALLNVAKCWWSENDMKKVRPLVKKISEEFKNGLNHNDLQELDFLAKNSSSSS